VRDHGLVEILPHRGAYVAELSVRKAKEIIGLRSVRRAMLPGWREGGYFTAEAQADILDAMCNVLGQRRASEATPMPRRRRISSFTCRLTSYCNTSCATAARSIQLQAQRLLCLHAPAQDLLLTPAEAHSRVVSAWPAAICLRGGLYARTRSGHGVQLLERLAELESRQGAAVPVDVTSE
jgi:DNA-binding GntR family transcriptional regulator